jgi:hypothetical protein
MGGAMEETTKQVIDAASVVTMLGTLGSILPPVAALFTIIWTGIRIYETDTVQSLTAKKRKRDAKGRFVKDDD